MKKFILTVLISYCTAFSFAQAEEVPFWQRTRDFVKACAVQPFLVQPDGTKTYGNLRSTCPELLIVRGNTARFTLDGVRYVARLSDSEYSDGGDLNDVTVQLAGGTMYAQRSSVPSFGDVILALAGGDDDFAQELVTELLPPQDSLPEDQLE